MDVSHLKKSLRGAKEHVSLASYATFRIGGKARYFFAAKTKSDIVRAVQVSRKLQIPFFILGGGSNVLFSDKGFGGLVIHIKNSKLEIRNLTLHADAGVPFSTIVAQTIKRGLAGLEWAGGLPGSVGGAVRGNAGAFGGETKDCLAKVECIDSNGRIRVLSKKQCRFTYRSSIFKEKKWIVLSATFRLQKKSAKDLVRITKDHVSYRKERHPLEFPNAGSIFKNVDLKKIPRVLEKIVAPAVKTDPFPVVPTAFLLAKAHMKGKKCGNAQISQKHPNYIVNLGGAKASDVLLLMKKAKQAVKKKFSVVLQEEIEHLKSYPH